MISIANVTTYELCEVTAVFAPAFMAGRVGNATHRLPSGRGTMYPPSQQILHEHWPLDCIGVPLMEFEQDGRRGPILATCTLPCIDVQSQLASVNAIRDTAAS